MSIVSSNLHWQGWTGSLGATHEWTVVYRVVTDDPYDGPAYVVLNYGGPLPNDDGYSVGNDSRPDAICTGVTPSRIGESRLDWFIVATFTETPPDSPKPEQLDNNGNPTDNPLLWRVECEVSPVNITRPVESAWNVDALPGRPANTKGPVTSSAGEIYDPPPELDDSRWLYSISHYNAFFGAGLLAYQNAVNSDECELKLPYLGGPELVATFPQYTIRVESISARLEFVNNVRVWRRTLQLLYRKDTWRPEYLDKGSLGETCGDKPDGFGGTYTEDQQAYTPGSQTLVLPGRAHQHVITDAHGYAVGSPVLLDGDGAPLACDGEPKFFKWRIYAEQDLLPIIESFTGQ